MFPCGTWRTISLCQTKEYCLFGLKIEWDVFFTKCSQYSGLFYTTYSCNSFYSVWGGTEFLPTVFAKLPKYKSSFERLFSVWYWLHKKVHACVMPICTFTYLLNSWSKVDQAFWKDELSMNWEWKHFPCKLNHYSR